MSTRSAPEPPPASRPGRALTPWRASLLVAERELTSQLRSKAFLISLGVIVTVVLGGILLMSAAGSSEAEDSRVAVVGLSEPQLESLDDLPLSAEPADTRSQALDQLDGGSVEAVITSHGSRRPACMSSAATRCRSAS
ncbi:hypothetical protein [Nesterenkonia pannonica]|uniref:hypothetical protein n=1 Tax=Nesterenkonia pannonica TaxID=1548602 RepID=UPI0021640240|nr:hypothetical protein [Nesterenkonia pannonica]